MRPWLLLDVDGPLNPYAAPWFRQGVPPKGYAFHALTLRNGRTYRVALNPEHGHRLRLLAGLCDLAWATTWLEDANRLVAPLIGLPDDLPVVPLAPPAVPFPAWGWKTGQVAEWVGSRPFVWLDDEITQQTRDWLDALPRLGPHLDRHVPPQVGLTDADFDAVEAFARAR
ncbi:MAG: hypothetical protein JJE50_10950 [Actinomycetales bacterium]|nr:hypothetical protein [Actinomycetales bacterium]